MPTEPALGDSLIFQKTGGGPIYVRTPLLVRWPIWSERATSPGGYSVYEISPVSEIVVQSDGGLFRVNLARVRHGDGQQP
ncbi:MAG: DotH/IcmK family type IV secretion protein [Deltaproteobacteria bacterium]|nr:DotH/IcmK family type IV secretion protein [Deltaproteobacteria bacterium]